MVLKRVVTKPGLGPMGEMADASSVVMDLTFFSDTGVSPVLNRQQAGMSFHRSAGETPAPLPVHHLHIGPTAEYSMSFDNTRKYIPNLPPPFSTLNST